MVTVRLGVFGVLYTVPTTCVVASLLYEYWSRDEWLMVSSVPRYQPRPSLWIFLLRLFMSLVVGVTAAVWVWSPKTLRAWRRLFHRLGPYKQPPVKCHPIQYYAPPPHLPSSAQQRSQHGHKPHRKHRKHGSETTVWCRKKINLKVPSVTYPSYSLFLYTFFNTSLIRSQDGEQLRHFSRMNNIVHSEAKAGLKLLSFLWVIVPFAATKRWKADDKIALWCIFFACRNARSVHKWQTLWQMSP